MGVWSSAGLGGPRPQRPTWTRTAPISAPGWAAAAIAPLAGGSPSPQRQGPPRAAPRDYGLSNGTRGSGETICAARRGGELKDNVPLRVELLFGSESGDKKGQALASHRGWAAQAVEKTWRPSLSPFRACDGMTRAPGRGGASAGTGRPGRFGVSSAEGAMAVPCTLITSCAAEFPGEELVKRIIGTEELPQDVSEGGGVRMYPWTIDNKYYSADIHLCVVPNRFLVTAEIAESVQAFLVYFDSTAISGLDSISAWLPLVEEWLPEVMILVCDRVCENGVSRQKAQEWCIKHSFELVELSPEELPDEDDDFPESTGVKRIVQALNANVWSNVVMKNDQNQGFGFLTALVGANHSIGSEENDASEQPNPLPVERVESTVRAGGGGGGVVDADSLEANTAADPMLDMDIQELASLSAGEGDLENFGRLFSKLKEMKEKAATLPHEQRKLHAEKVTKAFWMAIGGDRDEIEGLSSDEDL